MDRYRGYKLGANSRTVTNRKTGDKNKLRRTIHGACKRGLEFQIPESNYYELINSRCYYCGEKYNLNLDRVNNDIGYILENVVPCCPMCNMMKRGYSESAFIDKAISIAWWKKDSWRIVWAAREDAYNNTGESI